MALTVAVRPGSTTGIVRSCVKEGTAKQKVRQRASGTFVGWAALLLCSHFEDPLPDANPARLARQMASQAQVGYVLQRWSNGDVAGEAGSSLHTAA